MFLKTVLFVFAIFHLLTATPNDTSIVLSKNDFLEFKIGSYINGFNEFDHSIVVGDKMVSVGIYYDNTKQDPTTAQELKKRFEFQISKILEKYSWAKNYTLMVSVYGDKRER